MVINWKSLSGSAICGRASVNVGGIRRIRTIRAVHAGRPHHDMTIGVLHAVDEGRHDLSPAGGDRGIGAGLPQNRGVHRAQGGRQHARHRIHHVEGDGVVGDGLHADLLRHPQGHQVQRLLEPDAQRGGTAERALIVTRAPAAVRRIDHDRRVEELLAGGYALFQGGQVHHRLEAGAGLAIGLGGSVELALIEAPAADHRQHAAGLRVERHQRALHQRDLPQRRAVRRRRHGWRRRRLAPHRHRRAGGRGGLHGGRLDHHDVAGLHDLAHAPGCGAGLAVVHGARPGHVR